MKFYIAARLQAPAITLKDKLEALGHIVTARWIWDPGFGTGRAYEDIERIRQARQDYDDVKAATDGLILLTEPEGSVSKGGRHVEFGMALAWGYRLFVIGRRENVFHWYPRVALFDTADTLLKWLALDCC